MHQDRGRVETMDREVSQLRREMDLQRSNDKESRALPALVASVQQAPIQPIPAAAPAPAVDEPHHKEEPRLALQPAKLRERLDSTFHAEPFDSGWAGGAQRLAAERLRETLPEGSEVRSVECRSSLCRIETSHTDGPHYQEFVRKAFLNPDTKLWNGGLFSTRLDDASQAEGRTVVVAYLARDGQGIPAFE
jgi:hypothetical protein